MEYTIIARKIASTTTRGDPQRDAGERQATPTGVTAPDPPTRNDTDWRPGSVSEQPCASMMKRATDRGEEPVTISE